MKNHKKLTTVIIILLLIMCSLLINGIYCDNTIEISKYSQTTEKTDAKLHFVYLSDLHNKEFGQNNSELVKKISDQNPDFIAVGGDMVTRYFADDSVMKNLLTQLAKIAPTYCCLGNHERDLADKIDIKADIDSTGALLLDNESTYFSKGSSKILIGGLSDYPYYEFNAPDYDTPEKYFWEDFAEQSKTQYSILLHHQPEYIGENAAETDIDMILCGHTHGGLVQIPFIGGVFAPNQGFFPKYDKGEFDFNGTKMIISSGLGNSNPLLRINNCAEICVIDVN